MKLSKLRGLVVLWVGVMAFLAFGLAQAKEDTPESIDGTTRITAEEVIDLVETKSNLVIVDTRAPGGREKGYIEGSIGLPDTDTRADSLAQHIPSKENRYNRPRLGNLFPCIKGRNTGYRL